MMVVPEQKFLPAAYCSTSTVTPFLPIPVPCALRAATDGFPIPLPRAQARARLLNAAPSITASADGTSTSDTKQRRWSTGQTAEEAIRFDAKSRDGPRRASAVVAARRRRSAIRTGRKARVFVAGPVAAVTAGAILALVSVQVDGHGVPEGGGCESCASCLAHEPSLTVFARGWRREVRVSAGLSSSHKVSFILTGVEGGWRGVLMRSQLLLLYVALAKRDDFQTQSPSSPECAEVLSSILVKDLYAGVRSGKRKNVSK